MKQQGGYTIIEASLALAVSASLVLLTFGLVVMVGNQRFRDNLTSVQSFIETQYNEVRTSINPRINSGNFGCRPDGTSSAAGNSQFCFMLGKLLIFDKEEVRAHYIIASSPDHWPDKSKTTLDNLKNAYMLLINKDSKGIGLNTTVKKYNYGTNLSDSWLISGGSSTLVSKSSEHSSAIAIIRSPINGSIFVLSLGRFEKGYGTSGHRPGTLKFSSAKTIDPNDRLAMVFSNGGMGYKKGLICISGGDSSAGISNNFNANLDNDRSQVSGFSYDYKRDIAKSCKNWDSSIR